MMRLFNINGVTIQGEPITVSTGEVVGCWFQTYAEEQQDPYYKALDLGSKVQGTVTIIDEEKLHEHCDELVERFGESPHHVAKFANLSESGVIAYMMMQPFNKGCAMTPVQVASAGNVMRHQGLDNLQQAVYDGRETIYLTFSHIFIGIEKDGYAHS